MNHASRGVVLAVAAVVLGLIILGQGFDDGSVGTNDDSSTSTEDQTVQGGTDDTADDGITSDGGADATADSADGTPTEDAATDADDATDGEATDGVATDAADEGTDATPVETPDQDTVHPPENVRVLVANDTTTGGLAGSISQTLQADSGYNSAATDSTTQGSGANSAVYFAEGYRADAVEIARIIGLDAAAVAPMPASPPVEQIRNTNVLVFVGLDLIPS